MKTILVGASRSAREAGSNCSCWRWACRLIAACLWAPGAVWGHAFWIVPFGASVAPASRVALDLRIGPRWPGTSTPRLPGLIGSFRVIDGVGTREVDGREGGRPVGHFEARIPGAAIVAVETNPSSTTLDGPAFQDYLLEEDLQSALAFRADLGLNDAGARESFSRAAKTLVFVGRDSGGFDRVLGQPLELVPLTDPLAYQPGRPFGVKLLAQGQPVADVRISALPRSDPQRVVRARTDADGKTALVLPHAGFWTFYAVQIAHAARPPADWESIWTSLTFEVPEPPR